MSKFLSGRQSNLKLGVAGYTENKTVLETTGRVGIGTTNAESFSLYVVGPTNITGVATFKSDVFIDDQLFVGGLDVTGHTELDNLNVSGIVTATAFHGAIKIDESEDDDVDYNLIFTDTTGFGDPTNPHHALQIDNGGVTFNPGTNTLSSQNALHSGSIGLGAYLYHINDVDTFVGFPINDTVSVRTNGVDRIYATSVGNVGINTTVPAYVLDVTGTGRFTSAVDLDSHLRVTGLSTFQNNVHLLDDDKLLIGGSVGTHDGLEIYHDGNHSYIDDSGTGNLFLRSGTLSVQNLAGSKTSAVFQSGSSQQLYFNNSLKFETTGIGVSISNGGTDTATIAGPENLILDPAAVGDNTGIVRIKGDLYVDGTEFKVDSSTINLADLKVGIATNVSTSLLLDGGGIGIGDPDVVGLEKTLLWNHTNNRMEFNANLYAPNFYTGNIEASGDVDIDGHTELDQLRVSGVSTFQGNVDLGDNDRLRFGDNQDLQIYHNSTNNNSVIAESGSGSLNINADKIKLQSATGGETLAVFREGGSVSLNYDNSKKFETIGYGVTIYNDLTVGTGVTIYGNAGIVSAISFYGDGSNLTNTGATLSATSGVERLVTTQLTSGTMVDAATDADLTFDAGTNTLNTENIKISGGISTDGTDYGQQFQLLRAQGNGKWEWATVPGIFSVNNILNGFNVLEEGGQVGTAGSIHTLDFRGINVTATADPQPNGIATITFSSTPTFDSVTVNDFIDLNGDLEVSGVSTFSSNVHVGSGITMYAATGIVSATKLYGDGSDLTGINAGAILGASSGTQRLVMTGLTSGAMLNAATDADLRYNSVTDTLITENLNVVGLSTFVGVGTFYDDLYVHGNLNVTGDIVYDEISGRNLNITGIATFGGPISVGGSTGTNGQYLKSTGVGVTWADFPTLRTTHTENANAGVTTFNFTYNVNFLDVFINGVKLTPTEYTASNGSTITLATPTFQDDIVELVSYNTVSSYAGAGSSTGISDGDKGDIIVSGSGTNWQIDANTIGPNELVNTSVTPGTYNFATLTVDADGRLTAASSGTETPESFTAVGIQSGGSLVGSAQTINFANNLTATVSNGVATIDSLGGGGGASVQVSDAAPSNPSEGDLWWRSTDGKGFIYYNDGNSNQWVEFNPSAVGIAGISTTGTSTFNVISANTYQGITTSMISDYGNGISGGGGDAATLDGIDSASFLRSDDADEKTAGDLTFNDSVKLNLGTHGDMSIFFNGSHTFMDASVGNINIRTVAPSGGDVIIGSGTSDYFRADSSTGESILYHYGNQKLATKSDGIDVTGHIETDTLNVSGIVTALSFVGDGSALTGVGGTVAISDNAPSNPSVGDLWWESDTASGFIYYNDGNSSQWVEFNPTGSAGPANATISDNAPSSPTHGDLWWESDTATGHIYYNDGNSAQWVQFNSGSSGGSGSSGIGTSRFSVSNTTGSIGAGTTADITITGAKAYSLFKIETSHAAWVRLYTDTTSRTNDASRAYTTDPAPGSGVLAEVYTTTSGSNTFKMTPAVTGWNDDATPSTNIYAKVTNNESTSQDITVTLTILRMED